MDRHQQLARAVVDKFKHCLDQDALNQISESQLESLESLVRQALSEELASVAEEVSALAGRLRSEVEKPELEL